MKAVIMAGGYGTRLWPLSTKQHPKQFQQIIGDETMIQTTYKRLSFLKPQDVYVSTNEHFKQLILDQLPEIPEANIIIEPLRRDTGPAMAFATHYLAQQGYKDEVVTFISSDHYIKGLEEFQTKLKTALEVAQQQKCISIVEVKAQRPDTNLGYVKLGPIALEHNNEPVYELGRFVEKPDLATAITYTQAHDYLWNTGMYCWHIATFLELLKQHSPEIANTLAKITDHNNCETVFAEFPSISIDYALMEKLSGKQVLIIPANFAWSDVGNWHTVAQELERGQLPLHKGKVYSHDSKNNVIYADTQTAQKIVTIGVENLAIISHNNQILICPKKRASEIKNILQQYPELG